MKATAWAEGAIEIGGLSVTHELQSYRDLLAWQASCDLAQAVYEAVATFPGSERYGLTGQMQRAAVSVPANRRGWRTRAAA